MEQRALLIGTSVIVVAVVSAAVIGVGLAESVNTTKMEPTFPNDAVGGNSAADGDDSTTDGGDTTPADGGGDSSDGTATPADDGDSGSGGAVMLAEVSQPSGGVADNESATISITLKKSDGTPVEGATLQLQSIGTAGEFDPGTEVETDSEGKASVEWYYLQPTEAEDFSQMPPSEQTSIAVQTEVDGEEVAKFVTVKLNIDPYREGCHSEGEDL